MKRMICFSPVLFLLLVACTNASSYPTVVKENFITSCSRKDEAQRELCTCIFDKIKEKYSYAEYVDMEEQMNAGQPSEEFLAFTDQATVSCSQQ